MIDLHEIVRRLPEQRWFGAKGRDIARADLIDAAVVQDGDPSLILAVVAVHYGQGDSDLFHLPLLVGDDGTSRDALEEPERLLVLGELMAHGTPLKGTNSVFNFAGPGLDPMLERVWSSARSLGADQSNTSVVMDESVIIKFLRRVQPGINPERKITRLLTNLGFPHIPEHIGEITFEGTLDDEEITMDIAVAQRYVTDAVEGWKDVLGRLHDLYDAAVPGEITTAEITATIEERAMDNLRSLEDLGDVSAGLHVALTKEELDLDSLPVVIQGHDLERWGDELRASAASLAAAGVAVIEQWTDALERAIERLVTVPRPGFKTRIHGDYHLGQVLTSDRGWMIIDFEGEPARSLEERRQRHSPLRDVAGMLRSFSYAASVSLLERAEFQSEEWLRLQPWADAWEGLARGRFLTAYLRRSHEGKFLPPKRPDLDAMLDAFEIDKALYEIAYEQQNRPDWIQIPLRGLARILGPAPG
jgi:trehalose synthase-fused probable maltokinase